MRLILQRVSSAAVRIEDREIARIGAGILVLVGVEKGDDEGSVHRAAAKLTSLRIFSDDTGRMNLDAVSVDGAFLVVSQFTLAASLARGRRPSFDSAAQASEAEPLVQLLVQQIAKTGCEVAHGSFGAYMQVELVNDGPVTFVLDV
jgi:D-tyrosyl-tRNA(Tyr) deacylase